MARVRSVGGTRVTPLADGWQMTACPPGRIADPVGLDAGGAASTLDWCPASVPSTAASALRAAGRWTVDDRVDFDARDWWWRRRFQVEMSDTTGKVARVLRFGGLATLAEVWLNGTSIVRSDDMFVAHEVDVTSLLRDDGDNELVVCCRSLGAALQAKRPRPRWRTRLVETQQLRWFRSTLLGRIPAWTPPAAAVGPWLPVVLEERSRLAGVHADVRVRLDGDDGVIDATITLDAVGSAISGVTLRVGACSAELGYSAGDRQGRWVAEGSLRIESPPRWWPHTHGMATRLRATLSVSVAGGEVAIDLGYVAFRALELDRADDGFALRVNETLVFCRGACWTPVDAVALVGLEPAYRKALEAVRDAGMNMVRVGGTFFYEDDAFYDLCDELGILVWQEYPFANMDYPGEDAAFVATVEGEARGFLERTQLAPCVAILCGNSEVEQQAAMMGVARDLWRSPLFARTLPDVSAAVRPDVPYWPSSPAGGALPFSTDVGTTHYFGVGAYLRPLEDARRADVRFAAECLAFANVPDERLVAATMAGVGSGSPPQDPRWKRRTPRDAGAGWDFEDVRDHYLRTLFGVDPLEVRYADVPRYLALSRVVTGEVMAATFAEWRRTGSRCGGALIWFLRDLWPGAGWGVLDADASPKAAYHYLRRVLQPIAVVLVDEGLNGIDAHVVNEGADALQVELRVSLFRGGDVLVAGAKVAVTVAARGSTRVRVAALLEHFFDTTYAYRFGPPAHDVTAVTLVHPVTGAVLGEAFHFPRGLSAREDADVGLEAIAAPVEGAWELTVRTQHFAQAVALDLRGYSADDNYFHVAPGGSHLVRLRPLAGVGTDTPPQGTAQPLNSRATAKVTAKKPPSA